MQHKQRSFRLHPLTLAVAAALAAPVAAWAQPTSTQIPGQGFKAAGPASINVSSSTAVSTPPYSQQMTVSMSGTAASTTGVVIQWGGTTASTLNPSGVAGFNIGSSAEVTFQNSVTGGGASRTVNVLNVDASGNPSYIEGRLNYAGPGSLWVANGNGVIVGGSAVINAPDGLGLVDEDLNKVGVYNGFYSSGTVPVNFAGNLPGNNAGLSVADGAHVTAGFAMLVGANAVNVGDVSGLSGVPAVVDGGIGGSVDGILTGTPVFNPDDSIASGNVDVATNVGLNLGASGAFDASALNVYADGDVTNTGTLTGVTQGTVQWINGTLTNAGELDFASTSGYADLGFASNGGTMLGTNGPVLSTPLYGNQPSPQGAGAFVNTGTLSATGASSGLVFAGAAFNNEGGITLSSGAALDVLAYSGGITLGGVVSAATGTLGSLYLAAASPQTVTVDTPVTVTDDATIYGANFVLNSTLEADNNFAFVPANSGEVDINGNLASPTVWLGVGNPNPTLPVRTDYRINGDVTGLAVVFGWNTQLNGALTGVSYNSSATGDVTGPGSITAGFLFFLNLQGSVHNLTSSNIAQNGFQINALGGSANSIGIGVDANGSQPQGVNLNVQGSAYLSSLWTQAVGVSGGAAVPQGNANSIYYLQASGDVTVNPLGVFTFGPNDTFAPFFSYSGSNYYNLLSGGGLNWSQYPNAALNQTALFQWPGLVYIQSGSAGSGNTLTVNGILANAWTSQAQTGRAGMFLLADNIDFQNGYPSIGPILTNGNAGVVMAAPFNGYNFGYATIDGGSPTGPMPTVYFWRDTSPTPSLLPTDTFTNENDNQQQLQTFLTLFPPQP